MSLPTIETKCLRLRPFTLDDAPVVQKLAGNRKVADTTANVPHPYLNGMAQEWIETHEHNWASGTQLTLAVTNKTEGLVGAVGLRLTLEHERAELGYWIGMPFWNNGYATEAAASLIAYGFKSLDLRRIQAQHLTRNPASGRVMMKVGMVYEGTRRQHMVKWDIAEDVAMYAILKSDEMPESDRS